MHIRLILLVSAVTLCFLGTAHSASATTGGIAAATTAKPQGFSARSIEASDDEEDFETQAQTHLAYRQQPQQQQQHQQQQQQRAIYDYSQSEEDQEEAPRQIYQQRNVKQQSNYLKQQKQTQSSEEVQETEEEEEEEPDRLSLLLAKSTFNCNAKTTGYYADESLNCEVFHYCQENQRHSWICPEGFTFHQIHLICMPPSNENICQQSSKYHIVNDYLYKPINLQEHQSKPNVTLRYSDRYYPESYYDNERYEDEDDTPRQRAHHQRQPVQVGLHSQQQQQQQQQQQHQQQQPQHQQPQYQQTRQPSPAPQVVRHQPAQQTTVYRKPVPTTTIQPQQLQPQIQQQQYRPLLQTSAPTATPTPYRFFTASSPLQHLQQQQQQVYRTPEEINISLQQRRPQLFVASSTPRYYEDEYLYERRK